MYIMPERILSFHLVFLLFAATLICGLQAQAQTADSAATSATGRKKVAVVLSGGGAKGIAHIGALKVIERAGVPVDIITGTSMGSLVGGLYAVGWNARQLDSIVRKVDWKFLLSDDNAYHEENIDKRKNKYTYFLSKSFDVGGNLKKKNIMNSASVSGFIEGKNLMHLFRRLTYPYNDSISFNKLPIPFACVATDIITNEEHDFHSGVLAEAMRTSMSIPGVFSPIRKGDMLLVDGGLRNNYPVDIARAMGADIVIGVVVQGAPKTADDIKTGTDVLFQIVDVNCKNKYDENIKSSDVVIRVNTKGYTSASFNAPAVDTLMRRGEEEAMKHYDELVRIGREVCGAGGAPAKADMNIAPQNTDMALDEKKVERRTTLTGNVGARFDDEELASVQIHGEYHPKTPPLNFLLTLRLGKRVLAEGGVYLQKNNSDFVGMTYAFRHNDINIYKQGKRYYNVVYNHHNVNLSLLGRKIRNFGAEANFKFDYYNFNSVLHNTVADKALYHEHDEHYFSYNAKLKYDSENSGTFPTRGTSFQASYSYITDNLVKYDGGNAISDISAMWRCNFATLDFLTLQPMVYWRSVTGNTVPMVLQNCVGGMWFGHYNQFQMPFPGVGYYEYTDTHFAAAQLKAQAHVTTNNYILLRTAFACHDSRFSHLFRSGVDWGLQGEYFYNTMLGPVGAALGYSSLSKHVNFFVNVGFEF